MKPLENDIITLRNKIEKGMKVDKWCAIFNLCCILFFTTLGIALNKINIFLIIGLIMLLFSCVLFVYNYFSRMKSLDRLSMLEDSLKVMD